MKVRVSSEELVENKPQFLKVWILEFITRSNFLGMETLNLPFNQLFNFDKEMLIRLQLNW
jgi:hypothetical protein